MDGKWYLKKSKDLFLKDIGKFDYKQIVILVGIYFILAFIRIGWLGLQADEVNFANVARFVIEPPFIHKTILGLPIFIMPYIGALKGYIYYIIVNIFPINVYTIRIPVIILSSIGIILNYISVNKLFNKNISFISSLILISCASFIELTVFDVGPNSIEFLIRSFSLLMLVMFIEKGRKMYFLLFIGGLLFGIYNKMNFIWFAVAISMSWIIYYFPKKFISKKFTFLAIIPFIFFILFFLKYGYFKEVNPLLIIDRLPLAFNNIYLMISGESFFTYIGGNMLNPDFQKYFSVFLLFLLPLGIFFNKLSLYRNYLLYFTISVIIFVQILITKRANAPWHYFMLLPYIYILITFSLEKIFNTGYLPKRILFLFVGFILIVNAWVNLSHFQNIKIVDNNIWNKNIFKLMEYTKNNSSQFVIYDWGIYPQLILNDPIKGKYQDYWPNYMSLENNDLHEYIKNKWYDNGDILYIGRSIDYTNFIDARNNFYRVIDKYSFKPVTEYEIKNDDGDVIYEVIKLEK